MAGQDAWGTSFRRETNTPGTFQAVANITDISGPSREREAIEVTAHDSPDQYREFATAWNVPGVLVSRRNEVPHASCPAIGLHLLVNHYPELYRNVADLGVRVAQRTQLHETDRNDIPRVRQLNGRELVVEFRDDLVGDVDRRLESSRFGPHIERGENVPAESAMPVVRDGEHLAHRDIRLGDIFGNVVVHTGRDLAVQRGVQPLEELVERTSSNRSGHSLISPSMRRAMRFGPS